MSFSSDDDLSDYDEMTLYKELKFKDDNAFPSKITSEPSKDKIEKDRYNKDATQLTNSSIPDSFFAIGENQVGRKKDRQIHCRQKPMQKSKAFTNHTGVLSDKVLDLKGALSSNEATWNVVSCFGTNIFDRVERIPSSGGLPSDVSPSSISLKDINMKITEGNITDVLNDFQDSYDSTEAYSHSRSYYESPNDRHVLCTQNEKPRSKRSRSDNTDSDPKPKLIQNRLLKMKRNNEQCKGNVSDANEAKLAETICMLSEKKEYERNDIVNDTETTEVTETDIHVNTEDCIESSCLEENEIDDVASQRDDAPTCLLVQKADKRLRVLLRKKNVIRSSYKCDRCFKEFKTEQSLKCHYELHISGKTYKCADCGMAFTRPSVLEYHIISKHSMEFNYKCDVCHKPYKHAKALKIHMNTHKNIRYKCDTCGKDFSVLHTLKMHIMCGHRDLFGDSPINEMECTICGKVLSSVVNLRLHMQIHEGNQEHVCDLCGALFSRKTDRDRHRMTHTGEKPYKCDQCDYACIQPGEFKRHKLKHSDQSAGQGRYTCPFCDKTLVRKNEMAGHIGKHIDDVKSDDKESHIACTLCNLVLKSRSELIFHVKRFHDKQGSMKKKVFECQICNTCQKSKFSLEKHMVNEHNQSFLSYTCDICGLKIISVHNLNRHKKYVHSTDDFPCPICQKRFKNACYLKDHVRLVHEKIKKYECSTCGSKFSERRYLRKHEQKHQLNIE